MAKRKVAVSYGHGANTYEDKRSKFVVVGGKVYEEHSHNAAVGTRLVRILKEHDIDVLEVQPANGKDVSLSARTRKANSWGADLYWSIHANAGTPAAKGWAAFYWKGNRNGERAAKLYAKHVGALGLPLYAGGTYPSVKGTWTDFHELRETKMTAVLTENGFMTNQEDFKKIFLGEGDYYNKMAVAHAKAILEYFGMSYKGSASTTQAAPIPTPVKEEVRGIGIAEVLKGTNLYKEISGAVERKLQTGDAFIVYGINGAWYNLGSGFVYNGDGSTVKYTPHVGVEQPKPQDAPQSSKELYRVKVNGETVGAFGEHENVVQAAKEAIAKGSKNISIERV